MYGRFPFCSVLSPSEGAELSVVGYMAAGQNAPLLGDTRTWVGRLGVEGDLEWQRLHTLQHMLYPTAILAKPGGAEYYLIGPTANVDEPVEAILDLAVLGPDGAVVSETRVVGEGRFPSDATLLPNGNLGVTGYRARFVADPDCPGFEDECDQYILAEEKLWVAEISSDGGLMWEATFGEEGGRSRGHDVLALEDGSLVVAGHTETCQWSQPVLTKWSPSGELAWDRILSVGPGAAEAVTSLGGSGFAVAGEAHTGADGMQIFVVRTDSEGNAVPVPPQK
jgi:hypothetical protein